MLHLFYAQGSCSLASHIALEEAGAEYETTKVDFSSNQQQSPEFLEVNPKGRVPALKTYEGIITETPAILTYIGHLFPEADLLPREDAYAMAKIQSLNAYICATLHVAHAHRFRGYRWADDKAAIEEMARKAPEVISDCFELIENELYESPYATGDSYTISDPYLYTVSTWMEFDQVDLDKVPRLVEYRERIGERAAVQAALAAQ